MVYREVTDKNSRGQIDSANIGYHGGQYQYTQTAGYHHATGQTSTITVSNGSSNVQSLSYSYDVYGNLSSRSRNLGTPVTETLSYDNLQRLTSTSRNLASGSVSVNYSYDAAGNFTSKSDYATSYTYDLNRPHVVTSVNRVAGGDLAFDHDDNGNLTHGDGEVISYNAFNKPLRIENLAGTSASTFSYGADLQRYRQTTPAGGTIYYIDKLMEIETVGTSTDYRHYLSDIAVLTKTGDLNDPNPGIRYLMRDRLGSVTVIGNESGTSIESRSYDAFGKPRNGNWSDKSTPTLGSSTTDRGFTDHEHLDDWQLIHMNGRGYDYNLGRFLSVDPVISVPGHSQSMNPFTYILNNPLSGTDPSGYDFCDALDIPVVCGYGKPQLSSSMAWRSPIGLNAAQFPGVTGFAFSIGDNGTSFSTPGAHHDRGIDSISIDEIGSDLNRQSNLDFAAPSNARRFADRIEEVNLSIDDAAFEGGFATFFLGRILQEFSFLTSAQEAAIAYDEGDTIGVVMAVGGGIAKPVRAVDKAGDAVSQVRRSVPKGAPQLVYRGGSATPNNLTPRPGQDLDGLSTFDSLEAAVGPGGKAQVIDTTKLKTLCATCTPPPPGHVSISAGDAAANAQWAATRGTGTVHPATQEVMDAVVDTVRRPK